jgi:hypothetical protein
VLGLALVFVGQAAGWISFSVVLLDGWYDMFRVGLQHYRALIAPISRIIALPLDDEAGPRGRGRGPRRVRAASCASPR